MLERLRTDLVGKLTPIKLLIINAGVLLTENQISYDVKNLGFSNGDALKALKRLGVKIIAFSTRKSETLSSIGNRLGIELFYFVVSPKSQLYYNIKVAHSVSDREVAFIGGDFFDIPVIEKAGFSVAPADAILEVKSRSYYITYGNGEGAVREVAELILRAKHYSSGILNES